MRLLLCATSAKYGRALNNRFDSESHRLAGAAKACGLKRLAQDSKASLRFAVYAICKRSHFHLCSACSRRMVHLAALEFRGARWEAGDDISKAKSNSATCLLRAKTCSRV